MTEDFSQALGGMRATARRIHDEQAAQLGKRSKPRRPDPGASDLDKSIAAAVELRALITEAHGATKSLNAALAEYRRLLADTDKTVDAAIERAANRAIEQWVNWMQDEQNKHAANLNDAVEQAREQIIRSLTLAELKFSREDDNLLFFKFSGIPRPFIQDVPRPHPDAGLPEGKI